MTFEEWYVENKQWDNYEDPVEAAWNYQQARIDELEVENKRILNHAVELSMTVPKGYVLVPVEPTEKMVEAGIMFHSQFDSSVPRVYKAMIQETQEQE